MSTPQDDKKSPMKRIFSWVLPRKRPASSTPQYPNARPTTATDVPSTNVSRHLLVSPSQGTSCVVDRPSTVPGPTGTDHKLLTGNGAPGNPTSHITQGAPTSTSASFQATSRESLPGPSDGPPVIANHTGVDQSHGSVSITNSSTLTNDTGHTAGTSRSPRTEVTASPTAPSELRSQVEETLAVCPKFRIVLVGNSGVGKSSLVSFVFNVSLPNSNDGTDIDIAHDRIGKADISREYYSDENPRFILHDSMGFEPGSTEKAVIVKTFLQNRAERNAKLQDQVHAIWLCIEAPRSGSRLLQTADEELLELAKELKIPVIVVFTKFDVLIVEQFRTIESRPDRKVEAEKRALRAFDERTKELNLKFPFVPVSTHTQKDYGGAMLVKLTQVTRDNLRNVEGTLWTLWATAQQVNARQKVDLSISEGLKKYWRNLGESVVFEKYRLHDCIARIHDDILKIWNFYDPLKVLSGKEFSNRMIGLVEPLAAVSDEVISSWNRKVDDIAGLAANVVTVAAAISSGLILPALGTTMALKFLHSKYQKGVLTATYLAAYIVDLILVLHEISMFALATVDPPKRLSRDLVMEALDTYTPKSSQIHTQLKEVPVSLKLEEKIASVIRHALGLVAGPTGTSP